MAYERETYMAVEGDGEIVVEEACVCKGNKRRMMGSRLIGP